MRGGLPRRPLAVPADIVYVDTSRDEYHQDPECPMCPWDGTCSADSAHLSRLTPCRICAKDLSQALGQALGSIPSGERRKKSLPVLQARPGRVADEEADSGSDPAQGHPPYGEPGSLRDPRFANRSRLGWGTATFGQSPDEFLGESTDDDNDWRGRGRQGRS